MHFEDILESLGSFGHWQRVIFALISLADVFGAFSMLGPVFTGATPRWYCNKFEEIGSNSSGIIPEPGDTILQKCLINGTYFCTNITFEDDFTSIVSEWSLVCSKSYVSDLITTIQMIGLIFGAALFGQVSDAIGRKKAYFLAFGLMITPGLASAFAPMWQVYAACRFLVGAGYGALMVVNNVYPLEFVGIRWRTVCGSIGFWGLGGVLLALCAFLMRDWRHLTILTSALGYLYFIFWLVIPESPRWLLSQGHFRDAGKILQITARRNGRPPLELQNLNNIVCNDLEVKSRYTYLDLIKPKKYCIRALKLSAIWFVVFTTYYGTAFNLRSLSGNRYLNMLYGGLLDVVAMLAVVLLNNSIGRRFGQLVFICVTLVCNIAILSCYISAKAAFLATVIQASALIGKSSSAAGTYVIAIWTAELFPTPISIGRRFGQLVFICVTLVCNIAILSCYISAKAAFLATVIQASALIGKSSSAAGTYVIAIWTAELFPTPIRNVGVGVGSVAARIGGILSPQIAYLGSMYKMSPSIITICLCVSTLPLIFLLPETNGKPLVDNIHTQSSHVKNSMQIKGNQSDSTSVNQALNSTAC